jgi:hypothetical protein
MLGRRAALALLTFLILRVPVPAAQSEIIDRVLAVVAGDVIMLSDAVAAREFGFVTVAGADPIRDVLNRLIDRSLMLAEVDRYAPPEPTTQEVDAELSRVRLRFAESDAFEAALARNGLTEGHLRQTIRQNLRIQAYLEQRFSEPDPQRRQGLVDEWLAGLRRRTDVVDYLTTKN